MGNPISSSTNSGCGVPPIWSGRVGVVSPVVRSLQDFADMPFQSLAFGLRKFGVQEHAFPADVSTNATGSDSEGNATVSKSLESGPEPPPRPNSV